MDIPKFYETIGVNYKIVLRRLPRESMIEKYLHLFLEDKNFLCLTEAIADDDYEGAFKAAHTLKGISLNLELTPLAAAASDLSEYLRNYADGAIESTAAKEKYEMVKTEYETIRHLIS